MSKRKIERDCFYDCAQDMFAYGDFNIFKLEKMFEIKKHNVYGNCDDTKNVKSNKISKKSNNIFLSTNAKIEN